jgi:ribosome-binding protein aMBF1 (putative translation factor)
MRDHCVPRAIIERHAIGGRRGASELRTVRDMGSLGSHIARNVAAERSRQRWDQRQLADAINREGWSRSTVSNLERGVRKVAADDLPILCAAFGIKLAKLVDGAEPADLRALGL